MTSMFVPDAVISLAIEPKDRGATGNFSKALQKFNREDPTFRVHRDEESGQTVISGMGELHLNIYIERMKREFKCEVESGQPQVAYRETITKSVPFEYIHKKQTGGAGQFAKVVVLLLLYLCHQKNIMNLSVKLPVVVFKGIYPGCR